MPRTDLTESQIVDVKLAIRAISNGLTPHIPIMKVREYIENLTGEVLRLRNEDAHARQLNDLEGEW